MLRRAQPTELQASDFFRSVLVVRSDTATPRTSGRGEAVPRLRMVSKTVLF